MRCDVRAAVVQWFIALLLLTTTVSAQSVTSRLPESDRPLASPLRLIPWSAPDRLSVDRPWRGFLGFSGVTHKLVTSEMKRKYTTLGGGRGDYTFWFTPRWAAKLEISFLDGTGQVDITDPGVQVEKNAMSVLTVPIMIEVLHRWRGADYRQRVWPYFGIGIGSVANEELIELRAVQASFDPIYVRTSSRAMNFAVSATAGIQFRVKGRLHGVIETRWLQTDPGRFEDLAEPKDADEERAYREFQAMIHRPEYNVSGWEGSAGLRWGR